MKTPKMRRPQLLISAAWLVQVLAWFLPIVKGGERFPTAPPDAPPRLGSAKSFTEYVLARKALGVEHADSYLADGHSEYFGRAATRSSPRPSPKCFPSRKPVNA